MNNRLCRIIVLVSMFYGALFAQGPLEQGTDEKWVVCTDPRPEMCTMEYAPVCAQRDNGIRCVQAPCPSTDLVTYSNACSACSDAKVYAYHLGGCR